ncbi:MAG: hypothetical protein RL671_1490 [Pseudomonadota bacterium]|jgi:hypothetical protein
MTDLDLILGKLREEPLHPRLALLDEAVLAELAQRQAIVPINRTGLGLAAVVALLVGLGGTIFAGATVNSAPVSPLGVPATLAPSTLLASR